MCVCVFGIGNVSQWMQYFNYSKQAADTAAKRQPNAITQNGLISLSALPPLARKEEGRKAIVQDLCLPVQIENNTGR